MEIETTKRKCVCIGVARLPHLVDDTFAEGFCNKCWGLSQGWGISREAGPRPMDTTSLGRCFH
jgi:hypothetical protein